MRTQPPSPAEISANLRSIDAVPLPILPDGLARSALVVLAHAGHEVYAYASGGEQTGTWCIWWQERADSRADHDGRLTVAQWCERWRELIGEAHGIRRTGGVA